jgi:colicin import membrane protein
MARAATEGGAGAKPPKPHAPQAGNSTVMAAAGTGSAAVPHAKPHKAVQAAAVARAAAARALQLAAAAAAAAEEAAAAADAAAQAAEEYS